MKLSEVPGGSYKAKAVGGMFEQIGSKQTPAVTLGFEFKVGEETLKMRHSLWLVNTELKDGSTVFERSMDTLALLGWDAAKPLLTLSDGRKWFDKTFLTDKEVEIVIEQGIYEDKPQTRIKWVNELGGAQMGGLPVHVVLPNVDIQSAMAAARARMGVKAPPKAPTPTVVGNFVPPATQVDIPF